MSEDNKPLVVALDDVPASCAGTPMPVVIADDYQVSVHYVAPQRVPRFASDAGAIELRMAEDAVASIRFIRNKAHYFGSPNDEAIEGHPLYAFGLRAYGAFEVVNSAWIEELCARNRVHRAHKDEHFAKYRHFIFTFHDATLEVIAQGYEVEVEPDGSVFDVAIKKMRRWSNE